MIKTRGRTDSFSLASRLNCLRATKGFHSCELLSAARLATKPENEETSGACWLILDNLV